MKEKIKNPFALLLLLLLSSCGLVPTAEPGQEWVPFTGDFETGDLGGFYFLVNDTAFNTVVVTSPVRKGSFALRNTLRPEDYVYNGYRTELSVINCAKYQTEVFYGFSFYIDSSYADERFNLICQWQDLPYYIQGEDWSSSPVLHGSSPPVALVYADGNIQLVMNENPSSDNKVFIVGDPQPVVKGQWVDMVFHMYWSDDETAYVEAWMNGTPFTPFNGADHKFYRRNLFNRTGNYFKFGQYRGKEQPLATNIIYFDELKTGESYAEVAP